MKTRKFTFLVLLLSVSMLSTAQFLAPSGGWDYIYNGDQADTTAEAGLDGTYEVSRSSFEWDYTAPGDGAPGGAGIITEGDYTFLRMQDTGDPRTLGAVNTGNGLSNRKVGFIHCVSHGGLDSMAAILDDGITFAFRARIPTSGVDNLYGDAIVTYPTQGDGYEIDDHGYGPIKISQFFGDVSKTIGFSLVTDFDYAELSTYGGPGLYMNLLNGTAPVKEVGFPGNLSETTVVNKINLDPTLWHEFWIQISPGGTGTHIVKIWMDGDANSPQSFNVTAGANSFRDMSFFWMAFKNTGESGALDIDYIAYKSGLVDPAATSVKDHAQNLDKNLKTYPNPLNVAGSVEFRLEQSGFTTLRVYNALGQIVKTLISQEMPTGTHVKNFSMKDLSEGLYLLKLESGKQTEVDRIIIQK